MQRWEGISADLNREKMKASSDLASLARGIPPASGGYPRIDLGDFRLDLERGYSGPVRPSSISNWAALWHLNERESADWCGGFNYAVEIAGFWFEFHLNNGIFGSGFTMRKSNLLGRLVRGEGIRQRPCPRHQGRRGHGYGVLDKRYECCHKTGWLPNEDDLVATANFENQKARAAESMRRIAEVANARARQKRADASALFWLILLAMGVIVSYFFFGKP